MLTDATHPDSTSNPPRAIKRRHFWSALRTSVYRRMGDRSLVRRAQADDFVAFEVLLARYCDRLYSLALGSLTSEGEAGEALCETALAAFRDLHSRAATHATGTWFYLHGLRTVLKRLNARPGRYTIERRPAAMAAAR